MSFSHPATEELMFLKQNPTDSEKNNAEDDQTLPYTHLQIVVHPRLV